MRKSRIPRETEDQIESTVIERKSERINHTFMRSFFWYPNNDGGELPPKGMRRPGFPTWSWLAWDLSDCGGIRTDYQRHYAALPIWIPRSGTKEADTFVPLAHAALTGEVDQFHPKAFSHAIRLIAKSAPVQIVQCSETCFDDKTLQAYHQHARFLVNSEAASNGYLWSEPICLMEGANIESSTRWTAIAPLLSQNVPTHVFLIMEDTHADRAQNCDVRAAYVAREISSMDFETAFSSTLESEVVDFCRGQRMGSFWTEFSGRSTIGKDDMTPLHMSNFYSIQWQKCLVELR
jgi:hypothetical protein